MSRKKQLTEQAITERTAVKTAVRAAKAFYADPTTIREAMKHSAMIGLLLLLAALVAGLEALRERWKK